MDLISLTGLTNNVLAVLGLLLGLFFTLGFYSWLFPKIRNFLKSNQSRFVHGIKIQRFEIISPDQILKSVFVILSFFRIVLTFMTIYFFITAALNFFSSTAHLSPMLLHHILDPFYEFGQAVIEFIPKFFVISIIILGTFYGLKFIKFLFNLIEQGHIKFNGFYAEWADPTYKIIRVLAIALCFISVFPLIPGSESPAFKGVTVFLGVLFSFGSTTAIGNVVAGIILTYMRPFKIGDWVRIASTEGCVREKNLLVTRIRTYKNEDITIPNSQVLGSHIINFDTSAEGGLIIHSTVTMNYDVPIPQAKELMLKAVEKTSGLNQSMKPFILNRQLHDFYTVYEVHAYVLDPRIKHLINSELNENLQDIFQNAGIEMVSPHFMGIRDANLSNLPAGIPETIPRNKSFQVN